MNASRKDAFSWGKTAVLVLLVDGVLHQGGSEGYAIFQLKVMPSFREITECETVVLFAESVHICWDLQTCNNVQDTR